MRFVHTFVGQLKLIIKILLLILFSLPQVAKMEKLALGISFRIAYSIRLTLAYQSNLSFSLPKFIGSLLELKM